MPSDSALTALFVVLFIGAGPVMIVAYFKVFYRVGGIENWIFSHLCATLAAALAVLIYGLIVFALLVVGISIWVMATGG